MGKSLSYNEACARLHFYENHSKYLAEELASEKKKSETMAAEIKEFKIELTRITDLLKLAVKNMYGKSTEKICIDCYDQLSFLSDDEAKKMSCLNQKKLR